MAILNLGGSDELDEHGEYYSYDGDHFDGSEDDDAAPGGRKRLIAIVMTAIIGVTGYALAGQLTNSQSSVEFGQGQRQNIQCVTNSAGSSGATAITVTPYAGFVNQSNGGQFTLDSIYLEGIPGTCNGRDFIVTVYDDTNNAALTTSETGTAGANYSTTSSFRFYFQDSSTVTPVTKSFTDVEAATDSTTDTTASLQITFDADRIASFANAGQVYKITVETAPH